jgi:CRISPR/Cas system Type II protein with McrA/HNH and RuvC-like nuclease domain
MTEEEIYQLLMKEARENGAARVRSACRRFMLKRSYDGTLPVKRKPLTPSQRTKLYAAQDGRCANCGDPHPMRQLEDDHVMPVAQGGTNDFRNRQLLCRKCNREKSDKLPMAQAKATGDTLLEQIQKRGCKCHQEGPHGCPIHGDIQKPPPPKFQSTDW